MAVSNHLPWQVTVAAKVVLSRIPRGHHIWTKVGLFNFGPMEKPEYAYAVFRRHFDVPEFSAKQGGFVCLELGPGHSLFSALVACAMGASQTYLVDVGNFAFTGLDAYHRMAAYLRKNGLPFADISKAREVAEVLDVCSAKYLTHGLESLREIPTQSVDFIFSHATFQQIRRDHFFPTLQELRRIQKIGGAGSHCVNMHDLIGGAANDLRFSRRIWESPLMANAGFYTNRIRYPEMLRLFKEAGFDTEVTRMGRWDKLPLARRHMAPEFSGLSEEDILIHAWDVILR